MNQDKINTGGNPERLRQAAYKVISAGQDDPALQLLGTTVALLAMCDALRVDVRRLLESGDRLRHDLDGPFTSTMRAIEAYAQGELR